MSAAEERKGTRVTFLDQTGAKSVEAVIADTVSVKRILPNIITKMNLPVMGPDGQPMSYSLDHKEGGKRLREDDTLPQAGVQDGAHLIVYPEIVAGGVG
jgi:type VII secretion system (Wss) protein YukD